MGILDRKEQDWRVMCATTPLVWDQITYTSPTHCDQRVNHDSTPFVRKANSSSTIALW